MTLLPITPNDMTQVSQSVSERRWDMDWLRVLAFGLLIFFHSAVLFTTHGIPEILNETWSPTLSLFVSFSHQFRLGLLFLVSGMGTCYAIKRIDGFTFLRQRTRRLLVPLLAGIFLVVPPMVYLEKLYNGSFTGSFVEFYPLFFTQGVYPQGNLSWHHYWFIAYLILFSLMTWPLFKHWRTPTGLAKLQTQIASYLTGYRIYVMILPLLLVEIILRPFFPGFRNLITDWASFSHWLLIFIAGYVFASNPGILDRCRELRFSSLAIGLVFSTLLFSQYYDFENGRLGVGPQWTLTNAANFLWFSVLRMTAIWAWLLTCVGFAAAHLNRPGPILSYLNGAVYPLFCLHLTITVALAFNIMPMSLTILEKYALIVAGTFALSLAAYETIRRYLPFLGPLIGAK